VDDILARQAGGQLAGVFDALDRDERGGECRSCGLVTPVSGRVSPVQGMFTSN
jgi:hypothetical protein